MNFVFLIPVLLLPLYYLEILGLRILPLITLLPVAMLAIRSLSYRLYFDAFTLASFFLLCLTALLSLLSLSSDVFFAALIFFGLIFSSNFIKSEGIGCLLLRVEAYYIFSALVMSLGVVFQLLLFKYFDLRFGMIGEYSNRIGFAFTWSDYSFLSLFIASAVPFAVNLKLKLKAFILPVLLLGTLVTSARTGMFSLLVFYMGLALLKTFWDLTRLRLKKSYALIFMILSILFSLGCYLAVYNSSRLLNLDGSGRIDGYIDAIYSIWDKPFFGFMFDIDLYVLLVGALPHNVFLYILAMTGVVGVFVFNIWLFLLLHRSNFVSNSFSHATYICCIGAQLIPSVYSMYFFAILISCINLSCRSKVSLVK